MVESMPELKDTKITLQRDESFLNMTQEEQVRQVPNVAEKAME